MSLACKGAVVMKTWTVCRVVGFVLLSMSSTVGFAAKVSSLDCSLERGVDRSSSYMLPGISARQYWSALPSFSWDKAMTKAEDQAGETVTKVWELQVGPLKTFDEAESLARCIVDRKDSLVGALPTFQKSIQLGTVLGESTKPQGLALQAFRDRITKKIVPCHRCEPLGLNVLESDGLEPGSIAVQEVLLTTSFDPTDMSKQSHHLQVSVSWKLKTKFRSGDFVFIRGDRDDARPDEFVPASHLEL